MQIRRAQKSKSKIRIGLSGPSGSGKTYSALLLAHGITKWNKICIIDTERQSADLYSDLGPYNVITLEEFEPQNYINAIAFAEKEGMEVIIVDSITHEWTECKNMVDKLGGRFQDWAKVTPIHNRFINAVTGSKAHVITTVRSKTDYAMTTEGGKTRVQKVGLKQQTREGFEYELTISLDLNINHLAGTSKDRTGLFMGADPFIVSRETGKKILEWAESGEDPVQIARELEKLMIIKGVSLENTLKHYEVNDLADLRYTKLIALKKRLNEMDDKAKRPGSKTKQPVESKKPESDTTNEEPKQDITDEDIAKIDKEEPKKVEKPTTGEIKMLTILIDKRAKQMKKGIKFLTDKLLKKMKIKKLGDLTKDQVKTLSNSLSEISKEPKKDIVDEAKEIFGGK